MDQLQMLANSAGLKDNLSDLPTFADSSSLERAIFTITKLHDELTLPKLQMHCHLAPYPSSNHPSPRRVAGQSHATQMLPIKAAG